MSTVKKAPFKPREGGRPAPSGIGAHSTSFNNNQRGQRPLTGAPRTGGPGGARPGTAGRDGGKPALRQGFSKPGFSAGSKPSPSSSTVTGPVATTASEMFSSDDTATPGEGKPAKVKKPKVPKPPVDPNEHITQRAFIGGLAGDVTPTDVEGRFKSFGTLKDVYLAKDVDGLCRGFGYVTLDTTRKDWSKCMALFNGAKWKGHVLKIEEANKGWQIKRQEDLDKQAKLEEKERNAALKKFKRNPAKHAEDMALITDKNMEGKRGWKRGRFGRPVITMKLDKMTFDPSHYKNNVEKLFNLPGKPLPLDQLVYEIDENEPVPKGKHLPTEVALAKYLNKPASTPTAAPASTQASTPKTVESSKDKKASATKSKPIDSSGAMDTGDDRAMMASILAGIDMSPRALSLDGSDFEDDDMGGSYMEDFGGPLEDSSANDLFGDVQLDIPVVPKAERESRPEDLFGDDDEEDSRANQPSLDFLDSDDDDEEGEYQEDQDEEMESAEEEDNEEEEDEEEDDKGLDEDTIKTISQLQGSASGSSGGLFDSDDEISAHKDTEASDLFNSDQENENIEEDQDTKATTFAEESNQARLKAIETREAKAGHVVFSDSEDYDSEDYEQMEADHAKKMVRLDKPAKSIFDSDSGSDEEETEKKPKAKKSKEIKEMFASDDEGDEDHITGFEKLDGPDVGIKEQFEGPGGRALFRMQTKIGTSDSRFQLTKDFLDDRIRAEDDQDYVAHQQMLKGLDQAAGITTAETDIMLDEDRQDEANVSAEKLQAMSVLRAMFGEEAVRSKKKEEDTARQMKGGVGYTSGLTVRYDPDAAPPPPPVTPKAVTTTIAPDQVLPSAFDALSESEEEEDDLEDMGAQGKSDQESSMLEDSEDEVPITKPTKKSVGFSFAFDEDELNKDENNQKESTIKKSIGKEDSSAPKFQVASDLKSLFAPTSGSFKLFGNDEDEEDQQDERDEHDDHRNVEDDQYMDCGARSRHDGEDDLTSVTIGSRTLFGSSSERAAPLSHSGSLFFFHFKNPTLLKRSNFKTNNKVFMRTDSMDEVTAQWEKKRKTMTEEFKRKHKSASRNKARASKRFKSNHPGGGNSQS
ncbi:nucleolar protein 8 [Podila clonocystis]|nr:nucleolar protein 8 [Podila clonocystis]KAG0035545.1 nucleolar protein 8 [Podila clonocystis]